MGIMMISLMAIIAMMVSTQGWTVSLAATPAGMA